MILYMILWGVFFGKGNNYIRMQASEKKIISKFASVIPIVLKGIFFRANLTDDLNQFEEFHILSIEGFLRKTKINELP